MNGEPSEPTRGAKGEKGARGRRGLAGGRGLTGLRGKAGDERKLPRRVFIAFVLLAITNAGALGYTLRTNEEVDSTQDSIIELQVVLSGNQCHILNRLAETKVFIRAFLEESEPETAADARRFLLADRDLTEGIRALIRDIRETPRCALLEELRDVRQEFR